jgi:PAS domain S-box-containing protein
MTNILNANEPQSLHALSWAYAQDGKFAVDATGILIDVNPAAEALTGYSRMELIGMHATMLHPEAERARVVAEFQQAISVPALHSNFHILRKDGRSVPVTIWSTEKLELDGQMPWLLASSAILVKKRKENIALQPRIGRCRPFPLPHWRLAAHNPRKA